MIFFTADAHFGHEGIIKTCGRPFENAAEMDEIMVALWNSTVSGNDTVYILGDLFYRHRDPESVLKELNGKKHLIVGNHDAPWMSRLDPSKYFISVEHTAKISDGKRGLILSHYPLLTWWDGDFVVHGHIHNNRSSPYWQAVRNDPKMLNAGVDINGFRPVTFDQLVINNDCFKDGLEEVFSDYVARDEISLWLDDLRPAPVGHVLCKSVNQAKCVIEACEHAGIKINVIDCDHDLGDYAKDGGDGIKLLDWLVERGAFYPIKLHTQNAVGRENMEREIARYWKNEKY